MPLFPVTRPPARLPPTHLTLPALLPPLPQPARILSTQGHTAGAFTPASQPAPAALAFHSPKHVVFTLSGMPRVHSLRSGVGERANGVGASAAGGRGERSFLFGSGRRAWQAGLFLFMLRVSAGRVVFELRATNYRKGGPCLHSTAT